MMLHQPLWLTDLAAYSFQAAAIVIIGSILPPLFHLHVPKARLIYWQTLLAACLLLPLIEPWRPARAALDRAAGAVSISMGPDAATGAGWPFTLAEIVLVLLLAGVLFRAIWIALGLRRVGHYRGRAAALSGSFASIDEARRLTSVDSPMLVSTELKSPATFGLWSPVVLLPQCFFDLPASQQRAIACHELLHVRRRDWAWNMLEESILAVLWFHPALWWAVRNIRLSREQTVDAEVVHRIKSRQAYLSALLEIAQQDSGRGSIAAPLFLRESQLAARVALMMKEVAMSRFRLVLTCSAAAAALLLTGGVAMRAFPLQRAAQAPSSMVALPGGVQDITYTSGLEVVHTVPVTYPPLARVARIQSNVVLRVTVDKGGAVSNVRAVSGHPLLVEAAVDGVRQWRFVPPRSAPAKTLVTISFRLPAEETARENGGNHPFQMAEHQIYLVGKNVRAPIPTHSPSPPYTSEARRAKLNGNVVLAVVVDREGRVRSVREASKPLGKGLDESAIKTVSAWRFKPGERDGKPVAVRMLIQVTFHFQSHEV